MAIEERDPHTGYMTLGHEWNGITELNRPVPKPVWFFLGIAVLFSIGYWILMPSWPLGDSYTKGVLEIDQRTTLQESLQEASMQRSAWTQRIEELDFAAIQADDALMGRVRQTGRTLFEDNCAVCHGRDGEGGNGFPRLSDDVWLWGGEPEAIMETLRVGINSAHPETRFAQMQAFGRDGILDRNDVLNVVAFVRSLSGAGAEDAAAPEAVASGAEVFQANCAACHGEDGTGNIELGAPNLTDDFWIYGGDRNSLFTTVYQGRQGLMPHWEARLSPLERKILALFVLDLGEDVR